MKYVIIIPDGAADEPLDQLEGKTPFEAANKPNTDRISREGRQGTVVTTPDPMPCGSDVCTMSLLGYDPLKYHHGRAPLEAAAMGIEMDPSHWIFRLNLVTVLDGAMQDHSAGHIRDAEGRKLLEALAEAVELPGMVLYPGVSYRNIMVDTSGRDWNELVTTPPHDIPGEPMRKYLPTGAEDETMLRDLIERSEQVFANHPINETRRDLGELPATHVWPWGQGQRPEMPSFESLYGVRGAMITAVDLLGGLAKLIGWDRLDVPGQTSYHDTDYAAAGSHAVAALADYDLVCVHVEAPDEASHAADPEVKVEAIEAIDEHVVGPVLEALKSDYADGWRLLYLPDHYTCVNTRRHEPLPPPFAMCGTRVNNVLDRPFTEADANESDLHIEYGHELMEYFLCSGLDVSNG
ncbi:MAG: cofactor-independent phosphoglycerate mutase [Phycisphaeraceae bacterium]|nr:cofactor-independent phosphoglycerate mutase [Phycisphaeraceae bacterium]